MRRRGTEGLHFIGDSSTRTARSVPDLLGEGGRGGESVTHTGHKPQHSGDPGAVVPEEVPQRVWCVERAQQVIRWRGVGLAGGHERAVVAALEHYDRAPPVAAVASRSASITASLPELVNRTCG